MQEPFGWPMTAGDAREHVQGYLSINKFLLSVSMMVWLRVKIAVGLYTLCTWFNIGCLADRCFYALAYGGLRRPT
jgi:hypothetical protein